MARKGFLNRKSSQILIQQIITYVILFVGLLIVLFPLFWMFSTSLKTQDEVFLFPPRWLPEKPIWSNFYDALTFMPFGRYFLNTCEITFSCVVATVLSASFVAYGFARLRSRLRDPLFILVLSTMMLPPQVTMIPIFILFKLLGWVDTFKPLIIPSFFGGGAFYIFLLRQFFMSIPREMDDSAKIDGCGFLGIYWHILLPQSKPALATVALFTFTAHWNDLMGPLIYLNSYEKFTFALGLSNFTAMYGATPWNLLMAASLVFVLPCLIIYFFAQNYFIQGIVVTGLKG